MAESQQGSINSRQRFRLSSQEAIRIMLLCAQHQTDAIMSELGARLMEFLAAHYPNSSLLQSPRVPTCWEHGRIMYYVGKGAWKCPEPGCQAESRMLGEIDPEVLRVYKDEQARQRMLSKPGGGGGHKKRREKPKKLVKVYRVE